MGVATQRTSTVRGRPNGKGGTRGEHTQRSMAWDQSQAGAHGQIQAADGQGEAGPQLGQVISGQSGRP